MEQKPAKPKAALVISLIAGVEIIFLGIFFTIAGAIISLPTQGGIGAVFGIIGIAWGALVIVSAVKMYTNTKKHAFWGSLIIVFSVGSIFGAIGGLFIGLILGIIGGVLGIVWSPGKIDTHGSEGESDLD